MTEKQDIRGYVNPDVPGESRAGQASGMSPDAEIYFEDKTGKVVHAMIHSVRKGSIVEVKELHCLAPATGTPNKRKRCLAERIETITKRGGIVREWSTGLVSKGSLAKMTVHATEQIAYSGRARKRPMRGRAPVFPTSGPVYESYRLIWHSRLYSNDFERITALEGQHGVAPGRTWLRQQFGQPGGGPEKTPQGRKAKALVYFIQDRKRVKIGHSTNPKIRIKAFTTHTALRLLATEPGGLTRERELQKKFAHLRIKGEWFYLKTEILGYIKTLKPNKS
jgi:hypothetical protein